MNKVKSLVLVLALALPVGIFLFLKFFGKNEFEVRPLFIDEFPSDLPSDCGYQLTLPYVIPDSILSRLAWNTSDSLTLFSLNPEIGKPLYSDRLLSNYKPNLLKVIIIQDGTWEPLAGSVKLESIVIAEAVLTNYKNCFLFVSEPNDLILVDHRGRIRGYYQLSNREEFDRLLMEINIILKQY
jgi:hypothetical protein